MQETTDNETIAIDRNAHYILHERRNSAEQEGIEKPTISCGIRYAYCRINELVILNLNLGIGGETNYEYDKYMVIDRDTASTALSDSELSTLEALVRKVRMKKITEECSKNKLSNDTDI